MIRSQSDTSNLKVRPGSSKTLQVMVLLDPISTMLPTPYALGSLPPSFDQILVLIARMLTTPEETLSYFADLPYSHVAEPVRASLSHCAVHLQ